MIPLLATTLLLYSSVAITEEDTPPSGTIQFMLENLEIYIGPVILVVMLLIARRLFRPWHDEEIRVLRNIEKQLAYILGNDIENTNERENKKVEHFKKGDPWIK